MSLEIKQASAASVSDSKRSLSPDKAQPVVVPDPPAEPITSSDQLVGYADFLSKVNEQGTNVVRAIKLLLDPASAKDFARPFALGNQGLVVYGQPLVIMGHSKLVAELVSDSKSLARDTVALGSSKPLNSNSVRGFLIVWILLNGLLEELVLVLELHAGRVPFSFADLLFAIDWANYFNINRETKLHEHLEEWTIGAALARQKAMAESKAGPLTVSEHDLLTRAVTRWSALVIRDPMGMLFHAHHIVSLVMLAGMAVSPDLELASQFLEFHRYLNDKRNAKIRLTEIERKWGIRWFQEQALPCWWRQQPESSIHASDLAEQKDMMGSWGFHHPLMAGRELEVLAEQLGIPLPTELAKNIYQRLNKPYRHRDDYITPQAREALGLDMPVYGLDHQGEPIISESIPPWAWVHDNTLGPLFQEYNRYYNCNKPFHQAPDGYCSHAHANIAQEIGRQLSIVPPASEQTNITLGPYLFRLDRSPAGIKAVPIDIASVTKS